MSALEHLRTELGAADELIKVQVAAGMNRSNLLDSHYNAILEICTQCSDISAHDVLSLTKLCNASPFTDAQKTEFAALFNSMRKLPKKKNSNTTQHCLFFENMIDTVRMRTLRCTPLSRMARAQLIAQVGRMINLHKPCEKTLFRMVQIMAWTESSADEWSQTDVWNWMNKLQIFLKAKSTSKHTEVAQTMLYDFPPSAADLPDDIKALYDNIGGVPPELNIPALDTVLSDKNKRGGRSPAAPSKDPAWMKNLSPSEREEARQAIQPKTHTEPAPVKKESSSSSNERDNNRDLDSLAAQLKSEQLLRTSLALGTRAPEVKGEPVGEPIVKGEDEDKDIKPVKIEPMPSDNALADMETELLNAAKARACAKKDTKKRPASAITGMVKKRPSAKRPASSIQKFSKEALHLNKVVKMDDVFDTIKARFLAMQQCAKDRNKMSSQAYQNGVKRAKDRKAKDEHAKEFGRMCLSKISKCWGDYWGEDE